MTKQTGLTLIEMLIACAIASILAVIASEMYSAAASAARIAAARGALQDAVMTSQRKSQIGDRHIVLCSSSQGLTCSSSVAWEQGWMAFVDLNRDRQRQSDEMLILRQEPLDSQVRVHSTPGRTRLVFQPRGGANAGSNASFVLCVPGHDQRAIGLALANSGRLRTTAAARDHLRSACG